MTKHEDVRSLLAEQLDFFLRAIAVAAWRWRKPSLSEFIEPQPVIDQEETLILIDAVVTGILRPAFMKPVEIAFMKIFDDFFADPEIDGRTSLDLVRVLVEALGEALEG